MDSKNKKQTPITFNCNCCNKLIEGQQACIGACYECIDKHFYEMS